MDWRDLLAWQRIRTSTITAVGGSTTPIRLCIQDPHRIYLSITQYHGMDPHVIVPLTAQYSPGQAGINIGGAPRVPNSYLSPYDHTAGTINLGTGDVSTDTYAKIDNPVNYTSTPDCREWWIDRHGMLTQVEWWLAADGCAAKFYIIEVIQDRSPCEYPPKRRTKQSQEICNAWKSRQVRSMQLRNRAQQERRGWSDLGPA